MSHNANANMPLSSLNAVVASLLVEMDDHLGVAGRRQRMPAALQRGSEFPVVVDLAVEDDDDAAVLVVDRLRSSAEIDDAQTARAEPQTDVEVHPFFIGSAVADPREHAFEQLAADGLTAVVGINAADSAHRRLVELR